MGCGYELPLLNDGTIILQLLDLIVLIVNSAPRCRDLAKAAGAAVSVESER